MYIVEGNIGAGKSTFLKLIAEQLSQVEVVFEPRHVWQSDDGSESLLNNFYTAPDRWAYTMETLAMMCRVKEHLVEQQHPLANRLIERSIYSGHYCFAYNDFASGFMTPLEWSIYNQWFNFLVPQKCNPPLGFIYLDTTPEISYERIKKRSRTSEVGISLDYLRQIDECHRSFLLRKDNVLAELETVPVLVLDCHEDFEVDVWLMKQHGIRVAEFLKETQLHGLPNRHAAQLYN